MSSQKKDVTEIDRWRYESQCSIQGLGRIAGVDEAGRGPLAGPVMAAAVILPREWIGRNIPDELRGLNDSKQLRPSQRETYFEFITSCKLICWAVAQIEADEIDRINILQATHRAMNLALGQLTPPPEHALVDGLPVKSLVFPQTAIVKGDSLSYSIAAASVLAKVTRDRIMLDYDQKYPGYGFTQHKGYGTRMHMEALLRLGPSPIHRRTFLPQPPAQLELWS
jgi:ribonuclease HII